MKKVVEKLLHECKEDRVLLQAFKHMAAKNQKYELAGHIREFEREHFDISKEDELFHQLGVNFQRLLSMADISVSPKMAYKLHRLTLLWNDKLQSATIKDASVISVKADELFGND